MTHPTPSAKSDRLITRRHVLAGTLAAIAVGVITGCDDIGAEPSSSGGGVTSVDALVGELLIADKERLLFGYATATASQPDLAGALQPFVCRHEEHMDAVAGLARLPRPASESADSGPATPRPWPSPADGRAPTLRSLADAEEAASAARAQLVASARSGRLAAVVASIAACEAGHAVLLRELGGTGRPNSPSRRSGE